jgi:hypothetical protein
MPAGDEQTVDTRASALAREATVRDWLSEQFVKRGDRGDDDDEEVERE